MRCSHPRLANTRFGKAQDGQTYIVGTGAGRCDAIGARPPRRSDASTVPPRPRARGSRRAPKRVGGAPRWTSVRSTLAAGQTRLASMPSHELDVNDLRDIAWKRHRR